MGLAALGAVRATAKAPPGRLRSRADGPKTPRPRHEAGAVEGTAPRYARGVPVRRGPRCARDPAVQRCPRGARDPAVPRGPRSARDRNFRRPALCAGIGFPPSRAVRGDRVCAVPHCVRGSDFRRPALCAGIGFALSRAMRGDRPSAVIARQREGVRARACAARVAPCRVSPRGEGRRLRGSGASEPGSGALDIALILRRSGRREALRRMRRYVECAVGIHAAPPSAQRVALTRLVCAPAQAGRPGRALPHTRSRTQCGAWPT